MALFSFIIHQTSGYGALRVNCSSFKALPSLLLFYLLLAAISRFWETFMFYFNQRVGHVWLNTAAYVVLIGAGLLLCNPTPGSLLVFWLLRMAVVTWYWVIIITTRKIDALDMHDEVLNPVSGSSWMLQVTRVESCRFFGLDSASLPDA